MWIRGISRQLQDPSVFSFPTSPWDGLPCHRMPPPRAGPPNPRVSLMCSQDTNLGILALQMLAILADVRGSPSRPPCSLLPLTSSPWPSDQQKNWIGCAHLSLSWELASPKPASQCPGNKTSHFPGKLEDACRPSAVTFIKKSKIQEHVRAV